jgi:murein DD-endopeptidase MepM/ murein hydrolase activator NlpD
MRVFPRPSSLITRPSLLREMRGTKGNRNRGIRKAGVTRGFWRQAAAPLLVAVAAVLVIGLLAAATVGGVRFVAGQPTVQSVVAQADWWLNNTTPPQVRLAAPTSPVRGSIAITVTTQADGPHELAAVHLDVHPLPASPTLTIDTATLPDGEHTLLAEAQDDSLHRNVGRATATFRSDNTPPTVTVSFEPSPVAQGHTLLVHVRLNEPATIAGTMDGKPLTFGHDSSSTGYWAVWAPDMAAAPGPRGLTLAAGDALGNRTQITATVTVTAYTFPSENIVLPPDRAELLAPAITEAEIKRLDGVFAVVTPEPLWTGIFALPVQANTSSAFGTQRSYNSGPLGSGHSGWDLDAAAGTPVLAPARGRIVLAEALKVRGNAVIVDHGLGVYSAYYHLSEMRVRVGQMVTPGEVIGKVGDTGLSSGPHLHWEMRVGGVAVEPVEWTQRQFLER